MLAGKLPRWDLTPLFSDFDSAEFCRARAEVEESLGDLKVRLERYRVGEEAAVSTQEAFTAVIEAYNALKERVLPLLAYARLRLSADASDRRAAVELGELENRLLELDKIEPRLTRWLASFPPEFGAGDYSLLVREARTLAAHMISEGEEELDAELSLSGRRGWHKLYGNVSSRITVELEGQRLPVTEVRNRAYSPNEEARRAAYQAELAAC
ncbi:hypothetical protein [Oceanithermus sp.]